MMQRAPDPTPTLDAIVAQLATALGEDKSREVVSAAVQTLGTFDAQAVLEHLVQAKGIVGFAARMVRARTSPQAPSVPDDPEPPSTTRPIQSEAKPPVQPRLAKTISIDTVAGFFASSLGAEASGQLVRSTLQQMGVAGERLDMHTAMRLLETLAASPGLAGITARFVKARIILLFRSRPNDG